MECQERRCSHRLDREKIFSLLLVARPWVRFPLGWADLGVVPLTLVLSVPALLWFADHWTVFGDDSGRYLLAASQLISGQALEDLNSISGSNGGHGPVFPALIGALTIVFGRDTAELVWTVRLMALLNPLLAYFLVKRF